MSEKASKKDKSQKIFSGMHSLSKSLKDYINLSEDSPPPKSLRKLLIRAKKLGNKLAENIDPDLIERMEYRTEDEEINLELESLTKTQQEILDFIALIEQAKTKYNTTSGKKPLTFKSTIMGKMEFEKKSNLASKSHKVHKETRLKYRKFMRKHTLKYAQKHLKGAMAEISDLYQGSVLLNSAPEAIEIKKEIASLQEKIAALPYRLAGARKNTIKDREEKYTKQIKELQAKVIASATELSKKHDAEKESLNKNITLLTSSKDSLTAILHGISDAVGKLDPSKEQQTEKYIKSLISVKEKISKQLSIEEGLLTQGLALQVKELEAEKSIKIANKTKELETYQTDYTNKVTATIPQQVEDRITAQETVIEELTSDVENLKATLAKIEQDGNEYAQKTTTSSGNVVTNTLSKIVPSQVSGAIRLTPTTVTPLNDSVTKETEALDQLNTRQEAYKTQLASLEHKLEQQKQEQELLQKQHADTTVRISECKTLINSTIPAGSKDSRDALNLALKQEEQTKAQLDISLVSLQTTMQLITRQKATIAENQASLGKEISDKKTYIDQLKRIKEPTTNAELKNSLKQQLDCFQRALQAENARLQHLKDHKENEISRLRELETVQLKIKKEATEQEIATIKSDFANNLKLQQATTDKTKETLKKDFSEMLKTLDQDITKLRESNGSSTVRQNIIAELTKKYLYFNNKTKINEKELNKATDRKALLDLSEPDKLKTSLDQHLTKATRAFNAAKQPSSFGVAYLMAHWPKIRRTTSHSWEDIKRYFKSQTPGEKDLFAGGKLQILPTKFDKKTGNKLDVSIPSPFMQFINSFRIKHTDLLGNNIIIGNLQITKDNPEGYPATLSLMLQVPDGTSLKSVKINVLTISDKKTIIYPDIIAGITNIKDLTPEIKEKLLQNKQIIGNLLSIQNTLVKDVTANIRYAERVEQVLLRGGNRLIKGVTKGIEESPISRLKPQTNKHAIFTPGFFGTNASGKVKQQLAKTQKRDNRRRGNPT